MLVGWHSVVRYDGCGGTERHLVDGVWWGGMWWVGLGWDGLVGMGWVRLMCVDVTWCGLAGVVRCVVNGVGC